ncbi:MAG: hypothetical protein JWR08_2301 [Enterovirga sp.]|jgi:hypothetical protein|nr:hypothetical protein [Enterovirga sp.]
MNRTVITCLALALTAGAALAQAPNSGPGRPGRPNEILPGERVLIGSSAVAYEAGEAAAARYPNSGPGRPGRPGEILPGDHIGAGGRFAPMPAAPRGYRY